ncbi:MAG: glycosyltransferase family 39 protein [Gluconacetobacter diazotrophicus]|nr:glycosyltransferase family 39 protein [Gluconacetobacter diazotrophicus]
MASLISFRPLAVPVLALLALTLVRAAVCAATPLSPDEAYYWVWSHALAPGYLDHPPMVAVFIRLGTLLAGQDPLGVRLLAPLAAAAGSALLFFAGRDLCGADADPAERRRTGLLAAILLNATLILGAGAVTMTPDTPLLLFWTAVLAALGRAVRTAPRRPRSATAWWLAAGLAIGLALDSKYTAVLPGAGLAAWLLLSPSGRAHLRTPGPYLAALLAVLLFLPVLDWNRTHGWASLLKQGGRSADWHPARAVQFELELLGGQLGLATPILFAMFVLGIVRAARHRVPAAAGAERGPGQGGAALLAFTVLLPAAVFLQHALGGRVQANWPALLAPAAAIAAARFAPRWRRSGTALGFALSVLLYLQAATAILPLPRHLDPTLQRLAGWPELARAAARTATGAAGADGFLAADEYGLASELAFALPGRTVLGVEPRWRLFRLSPARPASDGLLLISDRRRERPDPALWDRVEFFGTLVRGRNNRVAERYRLYRVHLRPGLPAIPAGSAVVRLP